MSKKKAYTGVALVLSGSIAQSLCFYYAFPAAALVTAIAVCGIGLAVYASSKGRSLAWSLWAVFLVLGPILALLTLVLLSRKEIDVLKEQKPKTGPSEFSLKWGVLAYAACLGFVALAAPSSLWRRFFSDENSWVLSVLVLGNEMLMFLILIVLVLAIAFLHLIGWTHASPGWRIAVPWLVARGVLLGLVIAVGYGWIRTLHDGEQIADGLVDRSLAQLQPGMPRALVNVVLLEANASLLPKPQASLSARNAPRDEAVRNALKSAMAGNPVNFKEMSFHGVFFNVNKRSPSKKDPVHREVFVRTCCSMVFDWTRYDLFIEYDGDDRLRFARYLKSHHGDGQERNCRVRLEVPAAAGKQYPYACSPDVQDF